MHISLPGTHQHIFAPFGPCGRLTVTTILACLCLAACGAQPTPGNVTPLSLPPASQPIPVTGSGSACASPASATVAETEGPYFKAGSPERTSLLETGLAGTKLVLSGSVLTTDCKPVAGALLDFWQANAAGQYDNSGYTLRGHQFTDASGHYQLTTIVPGLYPGRTEHIHVKVQAPGGPVLTTQLFFPGVAQNQSDGIFDASLVMKVQSAPDGETAVFDFVIQP
ncbi:MAG TPA: hypothetical protein VMC09_11335 [Anaerolineales bacterium]|nr:hypothetical protein [Anaerolineales bacterium]